MSGGNVDSNPMHGSLFTGAGLPWGPMNSGNPGDIPNAPNAHGMDEFSAFDQSDLVKRLISQLRGDGAKQSNSALRQASRLGVAQSDAARRNLRDISAGVEDRAAGVQMGAAKEAFDSKMAQKQFAEQMDMQRYIQALNVWNAKQAAYEREQAGRGAALGKIAKTIGGAAGGFLLGGPVGAVAGGAYGAGS